MANVMLRHAELADTAALHACSTAALLKCELPICNVYGPIDLRCARQLHRYNEKMQRMQRGLEGVVDELFTYACPKFVSAVPPRLDNLTVNSNQEAYRHQLREFMAFVDQQRQLPVLKQVLKLYTTISLPKLAGLMDTDESAVKEQLRVLEVSRSYNIVSVL